MTLPQERRGRRRNRPRNGTPREPFALLHAATLLHVACRLPIAAPRVFLLAQAAWRPDPSGRGPGRAVLGYDAIRHPLKAAETGRKPVHPAPAPGRTAIARAMRALQAAELLTLAAAGTRPRGPGGGRGKAAEWHVPARDGTYPQRLPWPDGLHRPDGSVTLHVEAIRRDCAELTTNALRVLTLAVACRDRLASGALTEDRPMELRQSWLAKWLDIPAATVADALNELLRVKRLVRVQEARGRAPALYELDGRYRRALKVRRQRQA